MNETIQFPRVSIIIPHQAGEKILTDCIRSLADNTDYPNMEVLIVDNGSSDGSVDKACELMPSIRVVRLEENQGYAGGCNRGAEVADGEYLVFLNDDTEVAPRWLQHLVDAVQADPGYGACQPKILSLRDKDSFEYSGAGGGLMDMYGYPFSRGRLMSEVERDEGQYDDPVEIFWASGVAMFVRRDTFQKVHGFDETFFAYMEEIDLSWRIQLLGQRIAYVPQSVVYHIGGFSLDRRVLKRMYLNHRNSLIMLIKNYSARTLWRILPIRIVLEMLIFAGGLIKNRKRSMAIVQAFSWLMSNMATVRQLRREVQQSRVIEDDVILDRLYNGMAPIWYFLFGIHHVADLPDIERVLHIPANRGGSEWPAETVRPRRRDFLYAYLDQAPLGLALMRAIECERMSELTFERPILDVGCGNGMFARVLFSGVPVDEGIDRDSREVERARRSHCYRDVREGIVEQLPFPSESFSTVFSNSVLDQVDDIDSALREIARTLRVGGRFYMTVANPRCRSYLLWPRLLNRVGLGSVGRWYAELVPRVFNAKTIDEPERWMRMLEAAGFVVEHQEPYMSERATNVQDLFLPTAYLPAWFKKIFDRIFFFPRLHRVQVRLYRHLLRSMYDERPVAGSGTLLIARRG
jgi:GT2 family glycosyltransferase/ubiquinone/menaquinone biosynthesis C-methylase UbiE